jgi:hypothetical protein
VARFSSLGPRWVHCADVACEATARQGCHGLDGRLFVNVVSHICAPSLHISPLPCRSCLGPRGGLGKPPPAPALYPWRSSGAAGPCTELPYA